jgi:hypothetical protein
MACLMINLGSWWPMWYLCLLILVTARQLNWPHLNELRISTWRLPYLGRRQVPRIMSCHGEMAAMVAMVCGYGADFPPKLSQQILYHASK